MASPGRSSPSHWRIDERPEPCKGAKVMEAMLQMGKLEVAELRRAYDQG